MRISRFARTSWSRLEFSEALLRSESQPHRYGPAHLRRWISFGLHPCLYSLREDRSDSGFHVLHPGRFCGSPGRMNWEMIEELARGGVAIGSHGMAHVDLTTASDGELDRELTVSKSMLEDRLGQQVILFAFPYRALFPTCLGRGSEGRLHASLYDPARASSRF